MSLKAWAGLLGEFGRQSEAYASRQQELEDKRMEEERENRRLQALLAKEQGMARFNIKLGQEAAEQERNRPLTAREQALYDEELAGKKAERQYKEARAQYYSGGVDQVQALAEQIAEEQGISVEEALPLAQARIPTAGRRGGSAVGGGKSGKTDGGLELDKAKLFAEEKDDQTGKTVRRYLDKSVVPMKSDEEMRQEANARAEEWAQGVDSGGGFWDGLMTSRPKPEDIKKRAEEEYQQIKTSYDAQHKAAFEASRRQLDEFNAQPGGLLAPQGKTGQPEAAGKQPSLTDKIGKPNANATIDFEAALNSMWDVESNRQDFKDGEFVTSKKGARGKSQVMPKTADKPGFGINPADLSGSKEQQAAELNRVGKEYLSKMIEKYDGNLAIAYAAYNMGPGATDKWLKSGANPADLPKETRDYVGKTMAKYESYVSKKSNMLDGQEPQVAGEPGGTDVAPGKMPQEWVNGVLSRADREREASKQQSQKKGLLADPPPSPFGGFEAAAGAGMAPDEEAKGGESFGTTVGKAERGVKDTAGAVKDAAGATYDKAMGLRWGDIFDSLSATMKASVAEAQKRQGINDQMLEMMYAEQAKKGVPVEQFIKDFIEGYSGKKEKVSGRMPTDVTGIRG